MDSLEGQTPSYRTDISDKVKEYQRMMASGDTVGVRKGFNYLIENPDIMDHLTVAQLKLGYSKFNKAITIGEIRKFPSKLLDRIAGEDVYVVIRS